MTQVGRWRTLLACVAVAFGVVAFAAPAISGAAELDEAAQGPPEDPGPPFDNPDHPCYPDGCGPTTTQPPGPDLSCGLSLETGIVGLEVKATVRNLPAGETVRILVAGTEVARATSPVGPQTIRAMPTQVADVVVTFDIPDLAPGQYSIVAVGADFTVTCGGGLLDILGSGDDRDSGGLAFTGSTVLLLVLIALALLVVGYALKRRGDNRRVA